VTLRLITHCAAATKASIEWTATTIYRKSRRKARHRANEANRYIYGTRGLQI